MKQNIIIKFLFSIFVLFIRKLNACDKFILNKKRKQTHIIKPKV